MNNREGVSERLVSKSKLELVCMVEESESISFNGDRAEVGALLH